MRRIVARWSAPLGMALLTLSAAAEVAPRSRVEGLIKHGDDPRWAASGWDDHDWERGSAVPARSGIYWMRFRITISPEKTQVYPLDQCYDLAPGNANETVDSVFMAAPYSYDFFWDGQLIGRKGVVGATLEAEKLGSLDSLFFIPPEGRNAGEHVVALRVSTYHYNFPAQQAEISFFAGNYQRQLIAETRRPVFPLIAMGGALLVALTSLMLFWAVGRWRPLLLCSVLGFALALFYLLIAWRWLHNDPYDWFYPRLLAIAWLMTIIAALFPWLLLEQFAVPRRTWWLVALTPLLLAAWMTSPIYEIKTLWLCRATLAMSLAIAGWAVWHRRSGARFVSLGVLAGLLAVRTGRREFLDPTFFLTFGLLVLFVFTALGLQLRADRRRTQEALLTAARLEIEMLKKNIQPHFLMNTLTTIMEVIEQEPKVAVALIEALAVEFRILARVSGEKLIPLAQELELCRAHIRIMSLRRGVECGFDVRDVDGDSPVPPALFHTLVEGGFTHQVPRRGQLKFTLEGFYEPGIARYTLVAHGETPSAKGPPKDGTGLRYVKARLEESFASRWKLTAGPVTEGWQTVIEISVLPGEESLA